MNRIPDDLKHPSGGERLQGTATDAVRLAHKALERFPHLVKRHKFIAGGAAVSSSLVVLAGVAIARRLGSGQSEEEAIASLTEEELAGQRVQLPGDESRSGNGARPSGPLAAGEASADADPASNGAARDGAEADDAVTAKRAR